LRLRSTHRTRALSSAAAFALLAAPVVVVAGAGPAQAAGGTYRVVATGDGIVGWGPDSGAIDQTSDDAVSATGSMVSGPPQGAIGHADYAIESGPGLARARIEGSFTVPSGQGYAFAPQVTAVSTTELTISGPETIFVNTTVNLHVDGVIEAPVCGAGPTCGAAELRVAVDPFTRQAVFNTFGETRDNSLGLALDPVPGGYRVHGDVTSSVLGIQTNHPYPVTIVLTLSARYGGGPTPTTFAQTLDDADARYQASFAPTGPVLNDIPAGYTVSGPSVVDNHLSDPFADTTPPTVTGTPDREPNNNGWYREPVTIEWQATDDSGVASDPPDTVADQDGQDVEVTSDPSCDPSDNCATGALTLSLDQVPPVVTCREAPTYELATDSVAFLDAFQTDALSGAAPTTPGGQVDVSSVGHKSVELIGADHAGNETVVSCPYVVVDPAADTTPPVVTVPGDLAVDATSPEGAAVAYTASATDDRDPAPGLACTPSTGSTFAIGTTTVACSATDGAGNSAGASFTVHVRGTAEQLSRLVDETLADLDLSSYRHAVRAPLRSAARALAANRNHRACRALSRYVTAVRTAPGPAFSRAEERSLIADARRIRAVLGC
jgi:hypothetical protein